MRALERFLLLQIIDQRWREHLYDMDYLREGIHLRGFAQIDPLVAYKNEALRALRGPDEHASGRTSRGWSTTSRSRWRARTATRRSSSSRAAAPRPALNYSGGTEDDQPSAYGGEGYDVEADEPHAAPTVVEQRIVDEHEQIGRNDPCWCGSGKKYKKCHGA